jgi:hypothetical protein
VRFALFVDLGGRDAETKAVLERLARDPDPQVARHALGLYELHFLEIDRQLFDVGIYRRGAWPLKSLPRKDPDRALVDFCLGREVPLEDHQGWSNVQPIAPLDPSRTDDPQSMDALVIVGLLGRREDAEALRPFLASGNVHVALNAAKAALRLGDREAGIETLERIAAGDPAKDPFSVTEALYALRDARAPGLEALVEDALARVRVAEYLEPNLSTPLRLLAAEFVDDAWE